MRYPRAVWAEGSSPLTRGKPLAALVLPTLARLIPAHAGKTAKWLRSLIRFPAHPCSRGENQGPASGVDHDSGSSPLTRGKRTGRRRGRSQQRLIPAHAGKTPCRARARSCVSAHPQSHGENASAGVVGFAAAGSSPLTRGKRRPVRVFAVLARLIPAHAGKTMRGLRPWSGCRAHPRSRRGNRAEIADLQTRAGSSSLTRGKR